MRHLSLKTQSANEKIVVRKWHVADATNQTLGRMCSKIAHILRGKNKAYYTPHFDCGDYVIVINSGKVVLTGNKLQDKDYITYSGHPGGQKHESAKELINRRPNVVIERAVKGMLPKNRLGRAMYTKLFVYEGAEHPHKAQQPQELKF
jgi:large subunit ribosomal protein L13